MSAQDPTNGGNDEQWKKKKSAEFASAMLEFADKLEKKTKKKTPFTQQVLEQARLIRQDEDPAQRSRRSVEELRSLVNQLDKTHKETSKIRKASTILQPFLDGITRYSTVVDTLVQSDPTVSALVWGGARFVLQLAGEYSQHYENLTSHLEVLGHQLSYLGALAEIFDWSDELSNILMKSYQDVLLVLEAAADAYGQSGLRTVLKGALIPFDRKYRPVAERLEKNMQCVRDSAQAAQSHMLKKQSEDNEKKKLNQWLQAPATDATYNHCITHKHPKTCEWLFEESTLKTWEKATSQSHMTERTLWIYGPPGIGKTFLASSVIERLQGEQQEVIYYFFRDEKSGSPLQPGRGEALSMLRNLGRQLVDIIRYKRKHQLPKSFWDIYEKSGGTFLADIDSAVSVVQLLLAVIPRIHIVIDGLDECIDRHIVTDRHCPAWKSNKLLPTILDRLVRCKYHGTVKWCFTSCPESDLSRLFRNLEALSLEVTRDHTEEDVMKYVLGVCHDALDIEVDDGALFLGMVRCLNTANFLDARLTLELLRGNGVTSREELLTSVLGYKEGFNPRYLRGISILAAKPRHEKELARRIYTFVSIAERPITRNELLGALAVQPGSNVYSCDRRPKLEKLEDLLAPLLELDRSTNYSNPTVRFIHRTAREFMQQDPEEIENLPDECKDFFVSKEQKNLEFGKVCLTYLTRQSFEYQSTEEMEKSLCNSMDEDCNSFLKYASIFWYHHLNETSPSKDVFQHITQFMRSMNFLTCLWVQSKYAPYQMARYTTEEDKMGYHIENPTTIFENNPNSQSYYADPLPGWLSEFNEDGARLVQGCQLLIKEFGLVLLRRRGGIRYCHPCSLGGINFLPAEDQTNWKTLVFQEPGDGAANSEVANRKEKHLISVVASSKRITARTIVVEPTPNSAVLTIKEWQVIPSRKKAKALKLRRQAAFPFPSDSPALPFPQSRPQIQQIQPDVFAMPENDDTVLSVGSDTLGLLRASFESGCVAPIDCGIPVEIMQENHPSKEKELNFRGRCYATNGNVSVVSYRWSTGSTYVSPKANQAGPDAGIDNDSNSDSECRSDDGSDQHDSGYFSGSTTSSTTGQLDKSSWCTSVGVTVKGKGSKWYHFEMMGTSLRQSPPVVHPTKPFVLLPLDGATTVVINNITGETKELHDPSKKHAVSRIYHFSSSGDKLYEIVTTRDFVKRPQWNVHINHLQFDVDEFNNVNTVSIKHSDVSLVSWISPYINPYELPDHPALPFTFTWTEKHVYFVFGACEVYIARILLDLPDSDQEIPKTDGENGSTSSSSEEYQEKKPSSKGRPRVQTTMRPAFLPASTTERSFTYIAQTINEKEYSIFAIAGNSELPPVLIRQDNETDLGGWVEYDASSHIGLDGIEEDDDMKGKYSCNALSFHVPIRSGLAWNQRIVVVCGAE